MLVRNIRNIEPDIFQYLHFVLLRKNRFLIGGINSI